MDENQNPNQDQQNGQQVPPAGEPVANPEEEKKEGEAPASGMPQQQ